MNLLPILAFAMQLYETAYQAVVNLITTAISIFNDRIIMIIEYSNGKRVFFFPIIHIQLSSSGLKFVNLNNSYEFDLAYVKFVKQGKFKSKISKNESFDSMSKSISGISIYDLEKTEREFMKRFVFVELNGLNISKYFYRFGWSINDKFYVDDIQKIFSVPEGPEVSLDFTDDNLVVEQRNSGQKVLDQFDFIKRS